MSARRKDIARPFCGGAWTTARFFGFIRSALRNASSRWAPAQACLKNAEVGKRINRKSGRLAMHYRCAGCQAELPRKAVQIDHINEAGSLKNFDDLPGFAQRLFVEEEGFQILCIERCHHRKTHTDGKNVRAVPSGDGVAIESKLRG